MQPATRAACVATTALNTRSYVRSATNSCKRSRLRTVFGSAKTSCNNLASAARSGSSGSVSRFSCQPLICKHYTRRTVDIDLPVVVTDAWRQTFPEARVGLLAIDGVANPPAHAPLEERVRDLETRLRNQFAGADRAALLALPAVQAYVSHYRAFGQNYHVVRQLESVAFKGKPLTSPGALVLAMFAAEIESQLLTAGHDLDALRPPLLLDRSSDGDRFTGIGGQELVLRPGDML